MRLNEQVLTKVRPQRYELALARGPEEIRQAQRLRYLVFADEMGARLSDRESGLDVDLYDSWCEHLLVREMDTGLVVGTYRILPPIGPNAWEATIPNRNSTLRDYSTCGRAWSR